MSSLNSYKAKYQATKLVIGPVGSIHPFALHYCHRDNLFYLSTPISCYFVYWYVHMLNEAKWENKSNKLELFRVLLPTIKLMHVSMLFPSPPASILRFTSNCHNWKIHFIDIVSRMDSFFLLTYALKSSHSPTKMNIMHSRNSWRWRKNLSALVAHINFFSIFLILIQCITFIC